MNPRASVIFFIWIPVIDFCAQKQVYLMYYPFSLFNQHYLEVKYHQHPGDIHMLSYSGFFFFFGIFFQYNNYP